MNRLNRAKEIAEKAHEGQFDRGGIPYINHPIAVACKVDSEDEKVAALLHDVVEDTDMTVEQIEEMFGSVVAEAVDAMTRRNGESYFDYIKRAKQNKIARKVKMADLSHNMDVSRLPIITDADWKRVEKYKKAYEILSED